MESSHAHWISKSLKLEYLLHANVLCLEVFIIVIVLLKSFTQKRHFHQKEACMILHLRRGNVNNCKNCIRIVVVIKVYTPDTTASVHFVYIYIYVYIYISFLLLLFLAGALFHIQRC